MSSEEFHVHGVHDHALEHAAAHGGARPVAAMARMASKSSLRAPGGGSVVRPSSRRPRYLSLRFLS